MQKFKYKIRESTGNESSGEMEAENRFEVASALRVAGKTVVSVEEARASFVSIDTINLVLSRVNIQDLIIFAHSLSAMMQAGLSLSRALIILERQTKQIAFKKVIKALIEDLNRGSTLSLGMAKFPKVFSPIFVSMVHAGEESGGLSDALLVVGDQLEKSYVLKKKIKGAMLYPSIVIFALVVIAILMFIYVVPTLADTFRDLNTELPTSTKFIIGLSDFLKNHFMLGVGIVFSVGVAFIVMLRTAPGRHMFEFLLFRLPVVGEIVRLSNTARTTRTLSSLLSSGVDMVEGIKITKNVLQNSYYRKVMETAEDRVQKGIPLSSVFADNTNIYPLFVGDMVEVGEETGKLSSMLLNVALFCEREVDERTKNISTIIEPVLMVVIGVSVGFFAVSMITPMYSVMSGI